MVLQLPWMLLSSRRQQSMRLPQAVQALLACQSPCLLLVVALHTLPWPREPQARLLLRTRKAPLARTAHQAHQVPQVPQPLQVPWAQ